MTISRRELLGGSAALVGAGAVAKLSDRPRPGSASADAAEPDLSDLDGVDLDVMLSVTDAGSGTVEILVGEEAVELVDRSLVARIARATGRGAL
jgi:hypothetical protein